METFRSSRVALADWREEIHPAPWRGTRSAKPGDYKGIQELASIDCSGGNPPASPAKRNAQTALILVSPQARYDTLELVKPGESDDELALVFRSNLDCHRGGKGIR
jgi:hypothetical protein